MWKFFAPRYRDFLEAQSHGDERERHPNYEGAVCLFVTNCESRAPCLGDQEHVREGEAPAEPGLESDVITRSRLGGSLALSFRRIF